MLSSVCYFSCNVSYSVKAQIWEARECSLTIIASSPRAEDGDLDHAEDHYDPLETPADSETKYY